MEKIENKEEEKRDTTGDTKVFQIIRKEDIEREKQKQAIKNENKDSNDIPKEKNIVKKEDELDIPKIEPKKQDEVIQKNINQEEKKEVQQVQVKKEKLNNYQENVAKTKLNDYKNNNKQQPKKNNAKTLLIALLIIVLIALIATIFSTIFSVINLNSNKIINGVKINNIDISNLTKEQAIDKLQSELNNEEENTAIVKRGDFSKEILIGDIGGNFEIQKAIDDAYNIGRDKDIVSNNYKILGTMISGQNIDLGFTYEDEYLEKVIKEISIELPDVATESSYIIDGDKLIIKNSKDGVQIKKKEFAEALKNAFSSNNKTIEIPVEKAEKKVIDIEKIHEEIYKEPVNAYYTKEPRQVYKEEAGIDFAISIEEAKKILKEDKEEYEIPLKTMQPQIKVSDLDSGAYPDLLSTFTTYYGTADVNRNTNIAVAARSINSVVVMPGEVFSYNDLIGECSTRTGYKESTIYLNGELSTGIGGGICQVSTTLYNTVLRANLEIVQRRNHSLGVTYVPAGHDAMVSIGSSDFKFKNNRNYPVKVVAYTGAGSITCQIYGLKQPTEYEVRLESRTLENTEEKLKVETYKVLYLNGNVVSRTWLSTDTYKKH